LGEVRYRDLQLLVTSQLVDLCNQLKKVDEAPVSDFKSHNEALTSVKKQWHQRLGVPLVRLGHQDMPRRRKKFEHPPSHRQSGIRSKTKRGRMVAALTRVDGATVEECMEVTGWDYKNVVQNIWYLARHGGFGLREGDDGRIHIYV
jgi:hypothetical protein